MEGSIRFIPLSKLVLSDANVRKTEPAAGLDELVASISTHGLLQNLTVRPVRKANGKLSGTFEVIAGSRRLEALNRLAGVKRLAKNYTVPCHVLEDGNSVEVSLAENVVRVPLHPADQFAAFATLHREGLGADEIAGRFGISPRLVEQRLKLAAVSPRLIALYREGGMTLEQLMAFTISDDHEAQERVWFDSPLHSQEPHVIRRALTKTLVEGGDRLARFVGVEAYEAAGGVVVRDLFLTDDEGYFTDSELLHRLVNEKLQAVTEGVKAEGWTWVEVTAERDYAYLARMGRVNQTPIPLSDDVQATLTGLAERYDALIEEHGDNPPEEVGEELERLSTEIDKISGEGMAWTAEDKARAGVLIALDYEGDIRIERGLLKPQDRKKEKRKIEATGSDGDDRPKSGNSELPDTLMADLTAHRTAALRATLAAKPDLALTALLYTLILRTFYGLARETCVDVRPAVVNLGSFAPGIGESKAVEAFAIHHKAWLSRLPKEEDLWSWLQGQDMEAKLALLAYCTATAVNAVDRRHPSYDDRERLKQAGLLASAASLDMREWWEPTRERFLDRISKAQIVAAVTEGVSEDAAKAIANLKKDAMTCRAEELLVPIRWVPLPLRATPAVRDASDDDA
jgi:ParB family chromosome partitioning protein